jgi:hypothetical protein
MNLVTDPNAGNAIANLLGGAAFSGAVIGGILLLALAGIRQLTLRKWRSRQNKDVRAKLFYDKVDKSTHENIPEQSQKPNEIPKAHPSADDIARELSRRQM